MRIYLLLTLLLSFVSAHAQLVPTGLKIGNTLYRTNNIAGSFNAAEPVGFTVQNRNHTDSKAVLVSSDTNLALSDTVFIPANSLVGTEPLLQFTSPIDLHPRTANYNVRIELYTWSAVDRLYTVIWQPYFITSTAKPLPVTLTSFTGVLVDGKAKLNWTTVREWLSDYFALEVSTDGFTYVQKATVATHNTIDFAHEYGYTLPLDQGITYIRLVTVDMDGTKSYSPSLAFQQLTHSSLNATYLVRFSDRYFAYTVQDGDEAKTLQVIDWSGRTVSQQSADDHEVKSPGVVVLLTKLGKRIYQRVQ